ncbi:hypothetical protein PsYK624_068150 [Phanerochaete sordida]|uniref:BTB domain-containing protein n=1 Tax=Phanerochaete sordida TaxID=48140 RepID=A0A9P3LCN5_9APHY|nr:hypothetical protein PsYK624_068150 [Phanerochaete sordida]
MQAAPPPFVFNIAHADIIIRSSDGKDFPMYRVDLARSSPVFETMFSLPQPDSSDPQSALENGLPVVDLTESADVLQVLLRFYLPRPPPTLNDLAMVVHVLEGARKYELAAAEDASIRMLEAAAEREPLRVYAIACHFGLQPLARRAALACLREPLAQLVDTHVEELQCVSGEEFRRLIKYREDCLRAVAALGCLSPTEDTHFVTATRHNIFTCRCTPGDYVGHTRSMSSSWWNNYRKGLREKLKTCTWEGTVRSQDAMQAFLGSGACQPCCQVALSQVGGAAAYISSEIAKKLAKVELDFEMRSGTLSVLQVTGADTFRRRSTRVIKKFCTYGSLVLLGVLIGVFVHQFLPLISTRHDTPAEPPVQSVETVGRWFARLIHL